MFKAEVLQDYSAIDDSPSLRAWMRGEYTKAKTLARRDPDIILWRERCLTSPAEILRVHAVEYPPTSYIEWEVEVIYKHSLIKYGAERVYLLDKKRIKNWPAGDFWIFDNEKVIEWIYSLSGHIVGARVSENLHDTQPYLQLKDRILQAAYPVGV